MKTRVLFALVVLASVLAADVSMHAQLRGLMRRKADELIKGKPAAPTSPSEPAESPAPPRPTDSAAPAAPAAGTTRDQAPAADPLATSELALDSKANEILRGEMIGLPYINPKTVAAAKALDESARVTFVEKVGAAFKAVVMSDAFAASHAEYIRTRHKAVDHGIKGLVSIEELQRRNNTTAFTAALQREAMAAVVDLAESQQPEFIQTMLADELPSWSRRAESSQGRDRAKYQKMAADARALQALGTSDPVKLRRGFAVLRSMDMDGPATEAELYALHARVQQEKEQIAWDRYNLKATLKRELGAFITTVQSVDFAAATTTKGDKVVFTSPVHEKKGDVWKACFRAGKGPSTAALALAQAWLKELN